MIARSPAESAAPWVMCSMRLAANAADPNMPATTKKARARSRAVAEGASENSSLDNRSPLRYGATYPRTRGSQHCLARTVMPRPSAFQSQRPASVTARDSRHDPDTHETRFTRTSMCRCPSPLPIHADSIPWVGTRTGGHTTCDVNQTHSPDRGRSAFCKTRPNTKHHPHRYGPSRLGFSRYRDRFQSRRLRAPCVCRNQWPARSSTGLTPIRRHQRCDGPSRVCRLGISRRRAERATLAGTLMSSARIVAVVPRAWNVEARVPAARVG